MTRDEILAMKPGDELDMLVAEQIVGLKRGVDFGEFPEHEWVRDENGEVDYAVYADDEQSGPMCERCGYVYPYGRDPGPRKPCVVPPPPYSTFSYLCEEIVVPAMAKRGWDFAVYYWAESERYTAYFLRDSRHEAAYAQAEAGALSEAICKAALLAVLEEGEGA